jgi:hypothetical protein
LRLKLPNNEKRSTLSNALGILPLLPIAMSIKHVKTCTTFATPSAEDVTTFASNQQDVDKAHVAECRPEKRAKTIVCGAEVTTQTQTDYKRGDSEHETFQTKHDVGNNPKVCEKSPESAIQALAAELGVSSARIKTAMEHLVIEVDWFRVVFSNGWEDAPTMQYTDGLDFCRLCGLWCEEDLALCDVHPKSGVLCERCGETGMRCRECDPHDSDSSDSSDSCA